ncbi:hypothetical protein K9M74_02435 [Candidatus Woesearchaeota archaeon]|nr:hypothetical protein [Candidatus Woesearchaeota archaeon]
MFLFKFFGVLDMFVAVMLFLAPAHLAPLRLLLGSGLYLIAKGVAFKGDIMSMIDIGIGVLAIFTVLFPIKFLCIIAGIYLFLKGFYSVVA